MAGSKGRVCRAPQFRQSKQCLLNPKAFFGEGLVEGTDGGGDLFKGAGGIIYAAGDINCETNGYVHPFSPNRARLASWHPALFRIVFGGLRLGRSIRSL